MSFCVKLIRVLSLCVVSALLFYFGSSVSSVYFLEFNFPCRVIPDCFHLSLVTQEFD